MIIRLYDFYSVLDTILTSGRNETDLMVTATVGSQIEEWRGNTRVSDPDGVLAVPMVVRLTAHTPLNGVRVAICVEKPLAASQNVFVLRTVGKLSKKRTSSNFLTLICQFI